jgi:hypothetical protein
MGLANLENATVAMVQPYLCGAQLICKIQRLATT